MASAVFLSVCFVQTNQISHQFFYLQKLRNACTLNSRFRESLLRYNLPENP